MDTNRTDFEYVRFSKNRSLEDANAIYQQRIEDALDIFRKHSDSFETRNCPFCDSPRHTETTKFHDTYGVSVCIRCASYFVNPAPSLDAMEDYYNNSKCNLLLDKAFKKRKEIPGNFIVDDRVTKVVEFIRQHPKGTQKKIKILELGCGSGSFLSKLKHTVEHLHTEEYDIDYCGIDIDANAVASKVDEELNLVCSSVEAYSSQHRGTYDIIVHFELIEHLIDPTGFMLEAKRLLLEGGTMIFTTQNHNGLEMVASDYNSYRLLAHSIFPPMHLNAFSTMNVGHFIIRCGFNLVELTTPGRLDVDMVTETKEYLDDIGFKALSEADDRTKGLVQYLVEKLKVSSHMQCVLQVGKPAYEAIST